MPEGKAAGNFRQGGAGEAKDGSHFFLPRARVFLPVYFFFAKVGLLSYRIYMRGS